MRKYYYDANADECKPFRYGGCAGNANRFSSMEACNRVCKPQEPEPPVDGTAGNYASAFHINSCRRSSTSTNWSTWSKNVFEDFIQRASIWETNFKQFCGLIECAVFLAADPCALKKDSGPCTAYYPSWYFDAAQGQCVEFVYGGCGGNHNRFNDRATCEQRCNARVVRPVDPYQPDPYQPDRPVDPNQPQEPERPVDPYAPVEPERPIAPVQPNQGEGRSHSFLDFRGVADVKIGDHLFWSC